MPESGEDNVPKDKRRGADPQKEIDTLRAIIERERQALREAHEQHANQLRDQAATLGETFAAASTQALRGFERAEARLAALEQDLQGRMDQLSRDLQSVVEQLRNVRPSSGAPPPSAFPLESVMRIHEELRESDASSVSGADALKAGLTAFSRPAPAQTLPQPIESTTALTARLDSLERTVGNVAAAAAQPTASARLSYPVMALLVAVAGIALFSIWMQRRVDARLNDAAVRITAAERQRDAATELTNSRLAATREEAAKQVADARQSAVHAQVVGNVLAAPDLVRYWLVAPGSGSRAYAQVLFSRSRGMVFSASRLPAAAAGKNYQLWLMTRGAPVNAGLMTPDSAGRVTFATDVPIVVPRRLTGAALTLEPEGGRPKPSGSSVLVRAR